MKSAQIHAIGRLLVGSVSRYGYSMQNDALTAFVTTTFAELGAGDPQPLFRTILLREGYFVGYQFRCGDIRAVWFADSDVLKFHGAGGTLVRKVNLAEQVNKAA